MLRKFRKSKVMKNIILWAVIAVFILFVFVAWGSGKISGGAQNTIMKIDDVAIDIQHFEQEYYQQLDLIREQLGDKPITKGLIERLGLPEKVLQSMEYSVIIKKIAAKFKIMVSDEELADYIQNMPVFQKNGVFVGPEEYQRRVITFYRMSVSKFEEKMREALLENKLKTIITSSVRVSDDEAKRAYRINKEKFVIEYAFYPYKDVSVNEPEEKEIREYFQKHRNKYTVPEKRKGKFVLVSALKLQDRVTVLPKEIKAYYDDNKDLFSYPEKYQFRKIVVKNQDKLKRVQDELKKGTQFEDIAKKYSSGPRAKEGGLWKDVIPMFLQNEEKRWLERATVGDVSPPLKTKDGFEIIKFEGKISGGVKPLEEVKASIERKLKMDKAFELASEMAEKIYKEAKKSSLEAAAKKYGFEVNNVDFVEKGEPVNGDPTGTVSNALFNLEKGKVSAPIRGYSGFFIVELDEIQQQRQGKYEEFAEKIKEELKEIKAREKAISILSEAIKKGNFPPVVVHKTETHGYLDPIEDIELDYKTYTSILDAPLDKWSKVYPLKKGAFVYRIKKRIFDVAKMQAELSKFKKQMLQQEKDNFYRAFLIKESSKIKIKFNKKAFDKAKKEIIGRY